MEIYLILAFSFAIMYSFKYTNEVVKTTKGVVEVLDIEWGNFNPTWYYIKEFAYSFFMFPIAVQRLFNRDTVKNEVSYILENNYGLEAEK